MNFVHLEYIYSLYETCTNNLQQKLQKDIGEDLRTGVRHLQFRTIWFDFIFPFRDCPLLVRDRENVSQACEYLRVPLCV